MRIPSREVRCGEISSTKITQNHILQIKKKTKTVIK